ncbi:MAG: S-methyl-5-thioribose-1-phosphate isomerase [candidate division Zixibacteria bacterium]|nr:S-methyl-5-thioribose-1-phosphate isomerase [candidate division Zixibacteria bacterium]
MNFKTLDWKNNKLILLDQTKLPLKEVYLKLDNHKKVAQAIKNLKVRGAPAIGVAAAYGVVLGMKNRKYKSIQEYKTRLEKVISDLKNTRPTAFNLFWALGRMENLFKKNQNKTPSRMTQLLLEEAKKIHREDQLMCRRIGQNGARLLKSGYTVLTHCNAGALATSGMGTALSIIYTAEKQGKKIKVFVDETRPVLQGARLTTWELLQEGIDTTLICDDMAAFLMKQKKIDCIIVGADRIAKNGDVANKIGTYNLAVLAKVHKVPFYVAAPQSTFDNSISDGEKIKIEQRSPKEVVFCGNKRIAPKNVKVYSPAFDVTPSELVSASITDKGIIKGKRKD